MTAPFIGPGSSAMARADYTPATRGPAAPSDAPEAGPVPEAGASREEAVAGFSAVYIAEAIWFGDNPVDGRTRIAVCTTLDDALACLREHPIYGGDLIATEIADSALGTDDAETWAVHEAGTEASDEGHLWITSEHVRTGEA